MKVIFFFIAIVYTFSIHAEVETQIGGMPFSLSPLPGFKSTFPPFYNEQLKIDFPISRGYRKKDNQSMDVDYKIPFFGKTWYTEYRYQNKNISANIVRSHYECRLQKNGFERIEAYSCGEHCLTESKKGLAPLRQIYRWLQKDLNNLQPVGTSGHATEYTIYSNNKSGLVILSIDQPIDLAKNDPIVVELYVAQGVISNPKPFVEKRAKLPINNQLADTDCNIPTASLSAPLVVWNSRAPAALTANAPFDLNQAPARSGSIKPIRYEEQVRINIPISAPYRNSIGDQRVDSLVPFVGSTWFYKYLINTNSQIVQNYYEGKLAEQGFEIAFRYMCDFRCKEGKGSSPIYMRDYYFNMQSSLNSDISVYKDNVLTEYIVYSDRKTGMVILSTEQISSTNTNRLETEVELFAAKGLILDGSVFDIKGMQPIKPNMQSSKTEKFSGTQLVQSKLIEKVMQVDKSKIAGEISFSNGADFLPKIANVKLLSEPRTESLVVATMSKETALVFMGEISGSYLFVNTDQGEGWVDLRLIKLNQKNAASYR